MFLFITLHGRAIVAQSSNMTLGVVKTVAGRLAGFPPTGPFGPLAAINATLKNPSGIVLDLAGNMFIAGTVTH